MNENIRVIADKEDIVAIADAVREKLGSTVEMSLGEIVTNINKIGSGSTVNLDAEINDQNDIITQIQTALQGKSAGSSGANISTCTVELTGSHEFSGEFTTYDGSTVSVVRGDSMLYATKTVENVVCGSIAILFVPNDDTTVTVNGEEIEMLGAVYYYDSELIGYCSIPNDSVVTIESQPSDVQGI